jgi:DNA mismatch endonuclease (patch repair protein)
MSKVRSSNNKSTEIKFKMAMVRSGLKHWRIRPKMLFSPDFIFEKKRIAIFIDGCFWHGCSLCKKYPSSNKEYWTNKILKNKNRDKKAIKELTKDNWTVVRFWEHEIRSNIEHCIDELKIIYRQKLK